MRWLPSAARRSLQRVESVRVSKPGDALRPGAPPSRSARTAGLALVLAIVATLGVLALVSLTAESVPGDGINPPRQAGTTGGAVRQAVTVEELSRHVGRYPRDGRAWALLGYAQFEAERYVESASAFEKAVAVSRKVAADPGVWCDWADALGMAQGGSLRGRPEELVAHALGLDPSHPKALEMSGSVAYERRDFDSAVTHWRLLLAHFEEATPHRHDLVAAIAHAERLAATSLPPTR